MRSAGVLLAVSAATATASPAQKEVGEVRMFGAVAWAPGAHPSGPASDYPLPQSRALAGAGASLSFVSGDISAGPEALLLQGSDRRMFAVGGAARLGFALGTLRPYLLLGAGVYTWNHKAALPPSFSSPGQPIGAQWRGDVTQLAGNVGGGVMVGRERLSLMVEVRGHKSLSEDDWAGSLGALGLSVGGRVSW